MRLRAIVSGLLDSVGRAGQSLAGALVARLDLLSVEIAEERARFAKLALGALVVVFLLQTGVLLSLLFLVLLFGPEHRLAVIGITALVLLSGSVLGGVQMRRWLRTRPPIFEKSISQLRQDADRLESVRAAVRAVTGER